MKQLTKLKAMLLATALAVPLLQSPNTQAAQYAAGDLFVSVGDQVEWRDANGALKQVLPYVSSKYKTGSAFDLSGNFLVTDFDIGSISLYDNSGALVTTWQTPSSVTESIVFDQAGNFYVGTGKSTYGILKYDSGQNYVTTFLPGIQVDWVELASDQCTLYYGQEDRDIKRFDVCSGTPLADFASLPGYGEVYAIRLLPSGGLLVADDENIKRLDVNGNVVQTYTMPNQPGGWFSLALARDGLSFWAGSESSLYGDYPVCRFDLNSGSVLNFFTVGKAVYGLSVYGGTTYGCTNCGCDPVQIVGQPQNVLVCRSASVSFSVTVNGTAPFTFQWQKDGVNLNDGQTAWGSTISGSHSSILTITGPQPLDDGSYRVVISNPCGSQTSNAATLTEDPSCCQPTPYGLVSWWPANGYCNDVIGRNDATLEFGAGFGPGEVGQAFTFDGVRAAVRLPASPSLDLGAGDGFTFEAWINPSDVSPGHEIIEWVSQGSCTVSFRIDGAPGRLAGGIYDTDDGATHWFVTGSACLQANVYQHVAWTYNKGDGSTAVYVNGTQVYQGYLGVLTLITTGDIYLGEQWYNGRPASQNHFAGEMDEVSLYNRALSPDEIRSIYAAGKAGKCLSCVAVPAGVVGWWTGNGNPFDIIGGDTATLQGGVTYVAGEVGSAFNLGTSGYVSAPGTPALDVGQSDGFTFECWLNPADTSGSYPVVVWNGLGYPTVDIWLNSGALSADIMDVETWNFYSFGSDPWIVQAGYFQHIALTYDKASGVGTLYANGNIIAQQTLGTFTPFTTGDLYFGLDTWSWNTLPGQMDEITIYNRALTPDEIQSISQAGTGGKCTPPVVNSIPTNGLVSWWPGEGNCVDIFGGNNGSISGQIAYAPGQIGEAFNIYWSGSYIQIPASSTLNVGTGQGLTIECWMNVQDSGAHTLAEWYWGHWPAALRFMVSGGGISANLADTAENDHPISAGGVIQPGVFQHVAVTYDKSSGAAALYVDGQPVASQNLGTFTPHTSTDLYLGMDYVDWRPPAYFVGLMDEVRLYNRALTADEIQSIYNGGAH